MFFSIAPTKKENYSNFYQLGPFVISTDAGWHQQDNYLYKGYADNFKLQDDLDHAMDTGNYTILKYDSGTDILAIQNSLYRSYPLYIKEQEITNFIPGGETVWADTCITVDSKFDVTKTRFDTIGDINEEPLTFDQALDIVDELLINKTQNFLQNNQLPIRAFTSAGIDSTLVLSYLSKYTSNYELVKYFHFDYDKFWLLNSSTIQSTYWGYKQMHHWNSPSVLTSGAPGDEFMLRSPTTLNWIVRNNNTTMAQLLTDHPSVLHQAYFIKHSKTFDTEFTPTTNRDLVYQICNNVVNDWQHWHLGNTLTWTPLRDLNIIKTMLRVPYSEMLGQMLNSDFSLALIKRNNPELTKIISDQKNSGNSLSNLVKFYGFD